MLAAVPDVWGWLLRYQELWDVCGTVNVWLSPVALGCLCYRITAGWMLRAHPRHEQRLGLIFLGYVALVTFGSWQRVALGNRAGPLALVTVLLTVALILTCLTMPHHVRDSQRTPPLASRT